ncbi:MAG: glycosyltransferase [Acidimicrobiia bacterium]
MTESRRWAVIDDPATIEPLPLPCYEHLKLITTPLGVWEHCDHTTPRTEHGFCTDDNARALIVLCRQTSKTADLLELERTYLRFLEHAALPGQGFHNRRGADGAWVDAIGSDDSQGRAIWALGTAARLGSTSAIRNAAHELFAKQSLESPSPRANAFAILGAREILTCDPTDKHARAAMGRWARHLHAGTALEWPWPESRLAYGNARIPEGIIAAGDGLDDETMISTGLNLLAWLVTSETRDGTFSFTPVGGWALGESRPGFDQQPTEAAAMADACARAWQLTAEPSWRDCVIRSGRWLMGANDIGIGLYDPISGGCSDGLTASGPSLNQGAESTLAGLSVLQLCQEVMR